MDHSLLFTPRDAQNYRTFSLWMLGSMITFIAATILISGNLIPNAIGWLLTALAGALILVAIRAYMIFLRHADELLRKVHLDALAFGFGAGALFTMTYRLCERLGAPKIDINDPFLIMVLVWAAAQYLGARRYAGDASDA